MVKFFLISSAIPLINFGASLFANAENRNRGEFLSKNEKPVLTDEGGNKPQSLTNKAVSVVMRHFGFRKSQIGIWTGTITAGHEIVKNYLKGLNNGDCADISNANHQLIDRVVTSLMDPNGPGKPYFDLIPSDSRGLVLAGLPMILTPLKKTLEEMVRPSLDCDESANSDESLTNLIRHYFGGTATDFNAGIKQIREMLQYFADDTCKEWINAFTKLGDDWAPTVIGLVKNTLLGLIPESDALSTIKGMLPIFEQLVQTQLKSIITTIIQKEDCEIPEDEIEEFGGDVGNDEQDLGGFRVDDQHVEN